VDAFPTLPGFRAALALSYCYLAIHERAREEFEPLVDGVVQLPFDWSWYANMSLLAEACSYLKDTLRAPTLYERLKPYGDRLVVIGNGQCCFGSVWGPLALLAATTEDWAAAEEHFENALAVNRRIGARSFTVRTQRAYAEMLVARMRADDERRAIALAQDGLKNAFELGMPLEARCLEFLLDSLGATGSTEARASRC
jgi:tetratricopeptide (TPR) repeat protein